MYSADCVSFTVWLQAYMFFDLLCYQKVPTLFPVDSDIVSPLRLRWVKGVCVFRCNLPPALLADWPGSFTCHWGNTGMERTPNKSQHRKWTLQKKILLLLLPGFELATFRLRVRRSYQQAPGNEFTRNLSGNIRQQQSQLADKQTHSELFRTSQIFPEVMWNWKIFRCPHLIIYAH